MPEGEDILAARSGAEGATLELDVLQRIPGRPVRLEPDGGLLLGDNFEILRARADSPGVEKVAELPRSPLRRVTEFSRLASRLLRNEVRALARLSDGTLVAATRQGVFYGGGAGARLLAPSRVECGELALRPPMRIGQGPQDTVIWGEYGSSLSAVPVRIFASRDGGASHQLVHTFGVGEVGHVHNIIHDEHEGHYWVLAGDHGDQPGIGRLSADLERFEWFVRGEQRFRAVEVFDAGDRLVYATDTELETNALMSLDKRSGHCERMREFEGSCIYACRFGSLYALSTSVEPSPVNACREATLWISRDLQDWRCAWRAEKDAWSAHYFQFGSIVLPCGHGPEDTLWLGGQAVSGIDGHTLAARPRGAEAAP